MKKIFIAFVLCFTIFPDYVQSSQGAKNEDAVKKVLKSEGRDESKSPGEENAEDLKYMGYESIPLLAEFLTDYDLGWEAMHTMLVIDADKSAPFIFSSMPKSDRNVQRDAFKYFGKQLQSGQPFGYKSEMHEAAIRCLEADTSADAAIEAVLAIGLTGGDDDFPLLEKFYSNHHQTETWKIKLRNASEAALARLGNQKYVNAIETELQKPVANTLTLDEAVALSELMKKAAFSGNKKFIPLLCNHLGDPYSRESDYGVSPAGDASIALNQLMNNALPDDKNLSVAEWKLKCGEME